jgi:hypothetical protein
MSTAESSPATVLEMFVGGAWRPSASGETFEATSPVTGEVIGSIPQGDRSDAQAAIAAAVQAFPGWAAQTAFARAAALHRVADVCERRREELARALTLDQGKPLHAESYGEVEELVVYWRMAAADATRVAGSMPPSVDATKRVLAYRVPRGVVGVITPWNWPYTMPAEVIAPALAAGNTVVWTPASSTAICAVKLAECIVDAELPAGVFSMISGPGAVVGDAHERIQDAHGPQAVAGERQKRIVEVARSLLGEYLAIIVRIGDRTRHEKLIPCEQTLHKARVYRADRRRSLVKEKMAPSSAYRGTATFCKICSSTARLASSHGLALRSTNCSWLRGQPHVSTTVYIQALMLNAPTQACTLRTCC